MTVPRQGEELASNPTSFWVRGQVAPVREGQPKVDIETEVAAPRGAENLVGRESQESSTPKVITKEAEQIKQTIRRGEQKGEVEKECTEEAKTVHKEQVRAESTTPPSVREAVRPQVKTVKAREEIIRTNVNEDSGRGLLGKLGDKAKGAFRTTPPGERKPPESEKGNSGLAGARDAGSEMEVDESEALIRRPDIKPPPAGKGSSGSQVTEGNRRPFSPVPGSHVEEATHKRFHHRENRHEVRTQEDRKRKSEHRDIKVNQLRGPALTETAQQVREEEKEPRQESTCAEDMQVDVSPFLDAPASNVTPTVEATGAASSMEF